MLCHTLCYTMFNNSDNNDNNICHRGAAAAHPAGEDRGGALAGEPGYIYIYIYIYICIYLHVYTIGSTLLAVAL